MLYIYSRIHLGVQYFKYYSVKVNFGLYFFPESFDSAVFFKESNLCFFCPYSHTKHTFLFMKFVLSWLILLRNGFVFFNSNSVKFLKSIVFLSCFTNCFFLFIIIINLTFLDFFVFFFDKRGLKHSFCVHNFFTKLLVN